MVSVVVPVYNVEPFVGRCIESLLNQTYSDYEIIVVDDKTPDISIEIVEGILNTRPEKSGRVKIIRHEMNKGLPAARNTGMQVAKGKYLLHFDGDDYAAPDMLEKMVGKIEETGADIVYTDCNLTYDSCIRYMSQPECRTPEEALEAMLSGRMKYNVWNKLVRTRLYTENSISFPEGFGMGEDMTMIKLFAVARSIAYIPKAFYYYVKTNSSAMTATVSKKALEEINHNVEETDKFLREHNIDGLERLVPLFKLSVKYPLLFSDDTNNYKTWLTWFPETNHAYSLQKFGYRGTVLQWLASHKMYIALKLHYKLHSFVYNLKYKIR